MEETLCKSTRKSPCNQYNLPIQRIVEAELPIKKGPFTDNELEEALRKLNNNKTAGLDEVSPEVWKTRCFNDIIASKSYTGMVGRLHPPCYQKRRPIYYYQLQGYHTHCYFR